MKKSIVPIKEICIIILYFLFPMIINGFLPSVTDSTNGQIIIRIFLELLLPLLFIFLYIDAFKSGYKNLFKDKIILKALLYTGLSILSVAIVNAVLLLATGDTIVSTNSSLIDKYMQINIMYVLLSLIIAPIKEEITFRKALYDVLPNKVLFVLFSSIAYTIINVGYNASSFVEILALIPVLIVSAIRAYSLIRTDNVYTSILISMFYSMFVLITRFI